MSDDLFRPVGFPAPVDDDPTEEEAWEIAERSVDDFDAYDPAEHPEPYDDLPGSDQR